MSYAQDIPGSFHGTPGKEPATLAAQLHPG